MRNRVRAVVAGVLVTVAAVGPLAQQVEVPRLLKLPMALTGDLLYTLGTERQKLVERSQALAVATRSYNATCSEADVSKPCQDRKAATARETREYADAARTFNARVGSQLYVDVERQLTFGFEWGPFIPTVTREVDSLFVGGTGWVYGYVRRDDPAQQAVARAAFENSARVSSGTINPDDYEMIVGFAKSGSIAGDLMERVIGVPFDSDQATLGKLTSRGTGLYASLKTMRTPRLDCHSNGAMVCLHALRAGDIQSSTGPNGRSMLDVRLYGPQITPAAVRAWRSLITEGKIRSLEITFNEGDPVGPASYALGGMPYHAGRRAHGDGRRHSCRGQDRPLVGRLLLHARHRRSSHPHHAGRPRHRRQGG